MVDLASDDTDFEITNTLDVAVEYIATVYSADARGRSRKDDVSGHQREQARQIVDHLRNLPDHLVQVASLSSLTIDVQPYDALCGMTDRASGNQRCTWRRRLESFSNFPRPPHILLWLDHSLAVDFLVVNNSDQGMMLDIIPCIIEAIAGGSSTTSGATERDLISFLFEIPA
jgi:hypothetical protein